MLDILRKIKNLFFGTPAAGLDQGYRIIGSDHSLVKIHKNVFFGGEVKLVAFAPIEIGEFTMIAFGATIHSATHDHNDHPMWAKRIDRPVRIGKHVWIGANVTVIAGVNIEDYAVIGAGATVVKNVPRGAIVVGNPAKIMGYRSNLDKIDLTKMSITDPNAAEIIKGGFMNRSYADNE